MRYYYTDALAAAWMAREFGVEFAIPSYEIWFGTSIETMRELCRYCHDDYFYLTPDSEKILEPQEGDIKTIEHAPPMARTRDDFKESLAETLGITQPSIITKVIQREGKPFFWPEVEQ